MELLKKLISGKRVYVYEAEDRSRIHNGGDYDEWLEVHGLELIYCSSSYLVPDQVFSFPSEYELILFVLLNFIKIGG